MNLFRRLGQKSVQTVYGRPVDGGGAWDKRPMGVLVSKGYGLVRVRNRKSRGRKSVLEEIYSDLPLDARPDLPPGYSLDTSTEDAHFLRRADGSLVCAFVPQHANIEIVRRVAERDSLLSRGRRTLARHR